MTRILITGAQGALGWYVKQHLLNHIQNARPEIACINRNEIDEPGVENYCCDLLDREAIKKVIEHFKPEHAYLLAWETTHNSFWHDKKNINWADSTIDFAEQFAINGGRFLTFSGTGMEYQWSSEKIVEGITPEVPHSLYGEQKLRVTRHLLNMTKQGKLATNCSRLFFPYSERENKNRVTTLVVKHLLEDKPIHLRSGDVYRDICHTRNIAAAMCTMNNSKVSGLFNMSAGQPQHLGKFLKQIGKCLGKSDLVTWDDWKEPTPIGGEPRNHFGSNEKIKPYLNVADDQSSDIRKFVDATVKYFVSKQGK